MTLVIYHPELNELVFFSYGCELFTGRGYRWQTLDYFLEEGFEVVGTL